MGKCVSEVGTKLEVELIEQISVHLDVFIHCKGSHCGQ